jgi:hypothetical protein
MIRTRGRFNAKRWWRRLSDRARGTDFDRALRDAARDGRLRFVFAWNRGLGDIALGLVPLFEMIRTAVPRSRIEVVTRDDLAQAFELAGVDDIRVVAGLVRGAAVDLSRQEAERDTVVFADPDPTRWLDGRRREFPPRLRWRGSWNALCDAALPDDPGVVTVGAHVASETAQHYGYVKDWPVERWRALFARFEGEHAVRFALFGHDASAHFDGANVVDLRGRTSFLALLATIRHRCGVLVAPDSGVLTAAYYLDQAFPLHVVSLWSDPRQGILKQGCASPNPQLRHVALRGDAEDVRNLTVDAVAAAVADAIAGARSGHRHAPAH